MVLLFIVSGIPQNQTAVIHKPDSDSFTTKTKNESLTSKISQVSKSDKIFRYKTYVIEEYKLIFVAIEKVACTEWKRMLMRMIENPQWCTENEATVHDRQSHKLPSLSQYSPEVATALMTSPAWTKAVFVREPKERILSAFLDKTASDSGYYVRHCCGNISNNSTKIDCIENRKSFVSFLHYVTEYCKGDPHWRPQSSAIDQKWWPYFNFIGYYHNIDGDAKRLLSQLRSSKNRTSAWMRVGISGWGTDGKCENRTGSFLHKNTADHRRDSGEKLKKYYDRDTEAMVEKYWRSDWDQKQLLFPEVKLY
jgi:hypothetical protein